MKTSLNIYFITALLLFSSAVILGHSQAYAQSTSPSAGTVSNPTPAAGAISNPTPAAGAVSNPSGSGTFTLTNPLSGINSIGALVQNFVQIFSYIVILFAVLMFIYTGFQYITAQGNSTKIKELHARLLYIVIGVAVVIGARVIIDVVINTLSATGTVNPQVIQQAKNANSGN